MFWSTPLFQLKPFIRPLFTLVTVVMQCSVGSTACHITHNLRGGNYRDSITPFLHGKKKISYFKNVATGFASNTCTDNFCFAWIAETLCWSKVMRYN